MRITRVINLFGAILLFFHFPNLIFKIDDWIPFVHIEIIKYFSIMKLGSKIEDRKR